MFNTFKNFSETVRDYQRNKNVWYIFVHPAAWTSQSQLSQVLSTFSPLLRLSEKENEMNQDPEVAW